LILQILVLFLEWFCIFCRSHVSILTRSAEITTGSEKKHGERNAPWEVMIAGAFALRYCLHA
jgi:hypothetical protein